MGHVGGRVAIALALLLAGVYLLQAEDSYRPPPAPAAEPGVAVSSLVLQQTGFSGREYFVSNRRVVPTGSSQIVLPILMYHYIRTPPSMRSDLLGYRLSVSPADFEAQMSWLQNAGFHPVDFNEVRAYFAGLRPLPARPVVITIDDGYRDLYTNAYPILRAHGFTAVAYIVPGFIGSPAYVTSEQIVEMDRGGIEIASHTMSHADLARISHASMMYELVESKHRLEALVGHPVLDFAYPSGKFTPQTVAAVQQAGYDTAVTERFSLVHSRADRYAWSRVRVGGGEGLAEFITSLGSSMPSKTVSSVDVEQS